MATIDGVNNTVDAVKWEYSQHTRKRTHSLIVDLGEGVQAIFNQVLVYYTVHAAMMYMVGKNGPAV